LRKKEVVPLGPQYTGSKISRDAIEDEDSDDPFARSYDIGHSDNDSEEEEKEVGKTKRVSQKEESDDDDLEDSVTDEDEVEDMASNDEQDEDDDDESEGSEDGDEDTSRLQAMMQEGNDEDDADSTSKVRKLMQDTTLVTSAISQAAKSDAEKGQAIKTQRKTFDTLLNTRIRLQKALISTNSLVADGHVTAAVPTDAAEAAESAALVLLNNLTSLRSSLEEARAGQKRKRSTPAFTSSTPSSEIWSSIKDTESSVQPHRTATIEKWSAKTRSTTLASQKSGRLTASAPQTLTSVLTAQLQDSARLIKRTRLVRSCAPAQSAAGVHESEDIYDDADFYGLLLKELLENRSNELSTNGSAAEFVVQAPWQVAREAKAKKLVDTKASKGRKLRFTVHEKLQNFMAPEDRGSWGERQKDELFGGLFGRRVGLGEDMDEGVQSEEEMNAEEEGLMLFRS
jgi:protein AATF/BFR2